MFFLLIPVCVMLTWSLFAEPQYRVWAFLIGGFCGLMMVLPFFQPGVVKVEPDKLTIETFLEQKEFRAGQIKDPTGRHEKDDRHRIDDRSLAETGLPTAWPLRMAILLTLLALYPSARAADRYWDVHGNTAGLGGTGAWNGSNLFWNDNATGTLESVNEAPFTTVAVGNPVAVTTFAGFVQAGTSVSVTPHISRGEHLQLEYEVALNTFTGAGSAGVPPPRQTNSVQSEVTIPDGHTIIIVPSGYAINPSIYKLRFDPVKDIPSWIHQSRTRSCCQRVIAIANSCAA